MGPAPALRLYVPGLPSVQVPRSRGNLDRGSDGKPKDSLRGGAVCAIVGGTTSHLALHGNNVLVMRIPGGADLWAPGPKEKRHDTIKNPFGSDDVELRLARTDLKQCEDLAFDRQKPLRQHEP